ncbi:hypothetical protein F5X97DRAFT_334102 [Nemania serpens]|nr:hypothetical protein F5X97DRAFT_334102 [Nemania serpens]
MASPTVVLITGTTRGVGKAILELYLLKPDHIIISGNRDPNNTASQALVDPANAIRDLESHGVDHVDIRCRGHINTNVYGFIHHYQAFRPLLKRSKSLYGLLLAKNAAYPPTKLMEHWYTKAIHIEEPEICAFLIDPGTRAQTDLGNRGDAEAFGYEEATVPVLVSAAGVVSVVDSATRETQR